MAKPGKLALGVTARRLLRRSNRCLESGLAGEVADDFGHADRFHGRQIGRQPEAQERRHLVEHATLDHRRETRVTAFVKRRARRHQHETHEPAGEPAVAGLPALPFGERRAGRLDHLPGADQPMGVARREPCRRFRVARGEAGVECGAAETGVQSARRGAHIGRDIGHRCESVGQGTQIEPGAADHDGQLAGIARGDDLGQRHVAPARRRTCFGSRHHAVESVRDDGGLVGPWTRGQDVQLAVELHAVGVDDDAAVRPRDVEGEARLAARGRPGEDDDAIAHGAPWRLAKPASAPYLAAMSNVLTLIAAPSGRAIDYSTIAAAQAVLSECGAAPAARVDWLAPGVACDIAFEGGEPAQAQSAVGKRLAGAPVDVVAQPSRGRRKRLLVADMESTVIANEFVDELAEMAGVGAAVVTITDRAVRGELEFAAALAERVAMLAGLTTAELERAYQALDVEPGARALVATMVAGGAHAALVSGGFGFFADRVRTELGFDSVVANQLEIIDGRLAGRLIAPIVDRQAKRTRLEALASELGIDASETIAVGDGANDLDMLAAAGIGVAYRAKPVVAASADARIDHGDLTALLYIQGYRSEEIDAPGPLVSDD